MDVSPTVTPRRVNLLISFMDILGFMKFTKKMQDPTEVFDLLNGWAAAIVAEVEPAGGKVIKFIGDSCLSIFTEDKVDAGIQALLTAKRKGEDYLQGKGFATKIRATAHFGEVAIGEFGSGQCKGLDVLGDSVNIAATLDGGDRRGRLILSPQAFRKLEATSRKGFHKYTPPVVYVAEDE